MSNKIDILGIIEADGNMVNVHMRSKDSYAIAYVPNNKDNNVLFQEAYTIARDILKSGNLNNSEDLKHILEMETLSTFKPEEAKPSKINLILPLESVRLKSFIDEVKIPVDIEVLNQYNEIVEDVDVKLSGNVIDNVLTITGNDVGVVRIDATLGDLTTFKDIQVEVMDSMVLDNSELMDYILSMDLRLANIEASIKEMNDNEE